MESVSLSLPPNFPILDLLEMSSILTRADICVPGYIPPEIGLYDVRGYFYERNVEGVETVLLPDRNVASRFAQLAQGKVIPNESQRQVVAALLGFAQCLDIQIEPSVSFHELAHQQGNEVALSELAWFRAADNARPQDVIDVALSRQERLSDNYRPSEVEPRDLAAPLRRWNRNYIICLKMMELAQIADTPLDRVLGLLRWMHEDFIFGGPAALLASVYFAPKSSPKEGVFKGRNSLDREKAIAGVRNQAWDLTQLSDFVRRVSEEKTEKVRYLFASFDQNLRLIARLLIGFGQSGLDTRGLPDALSLWWTPIDAKRIAEAIQDHIDRINSPEWRARNAPYQDFIQRLILEGEQIVRGIVRS